MVSNILLIGEAVCDCFVKPFDILQDAGQKEGVAYISVQLDEESMHFGEYIAGLLGVTRVLNLKLGNTCGIIHLRNLRLCGHIQ